MLAEVLRCHGFMILECLADKSYTAKEGAALVLSLGAILGLVGCTAEGWDGDATTVAPVESENGLSGNGLALNGLSMNGLSGNGLSGNGLSGNGLSGNGFAFAGLPAPRGLS